MLPTTFKALLLAAGLLALGSAAPRLRPVPATVAGDCRQGLLSACRLLNPAPSNRSVAHLQFVSRTTFRAPGQKRPQEVVTSATLYAQGNRVYLETPQVILWQDGQFVTTVMHSQRIIYLTRVPPNSTKASNPLQFAMLRDSLIQRGKITQCKTTTKAGKAYQHISLNLTNADQIRYHATSLGFLLDNQSRIRELTVHYAENSPVSQVVYSIDKQEFIHSSAKLPVSARTMVFDKHNHLLPPYREYHIVDHTTLTHLPY